MTRLAFGKRRGFYTMSEIGALTETRVYKVGLWVERGLGRGNWGGGGRVVVVPGFVGACI